jgi:hypothetical protein
MLTDWLDHENDPQRIDVFLSLASENKQTVITYLNDNRTLITNQHEMPLTDYRIDKIADYYCANVTEIGNAVEKIKSLYDKIKKIEFDFYRKHDINIILEDDAVDYILQQMAGGKIDFNGLYEKISEDFEYGFKLIREKTHRNRFFLSKNALTNPENYLNQTIKAEFTKNDIQEKFSFNPPDFKEHGDI